MKKTLEARIYGRVQMVLFRDFACRRAKRLGLAGYARNETDGSVLVVVEGETYALETLLEELRRGPALAKVERVEEFWGDELKNFSDFEIDYS